MGFAVTAAAFAALAAGCAKEIETAKNEDEKRYFESWIYVHHPDAEKAGNGIYIISSEEGKGDPIGDSTYVFVEYTARTLEGTVSSTTDSTLASQVEGSSLDKTEYFGPVIWTNKEYYIAAGIEDMLSGMRMGGRKTAAIPGWLMTTKRFGTSEEYLTDEDSDGSHGIYDITLLDATNDMTRWQLDSIGRFFGKTFTPGHPFKPFEGKSVKNDSVGFGYGVYYHELYHGIPLGDDSDSKEGDEEDKEENHFPSDTTIFINYTGRLMNGKVFDTSILRIAQDNGLSGGSYEPMEISWGETYSELKIGSGDNASNMVTGMARALWQMHPFGKSITLFYSDLGYGSTGSGSTIPSYSPLIFEIEIVEDPDAEEE